MNLSTRFDFEARARLYVQSHPPFAWASTPRVLKNPLNGSGGTSRGARYLTNERRKEERKVGGLLARRLEGADPSHRWVVVLQRVSPKPFDDDGLAASLKSIRDGLAASWGVDDGADGPVWFYDWRKGAPKQHAVEVGLWVWREVMRVPERLVEAEPEHGVLAAPGPRLSLWSAVTPRRIDVRIKPNVVKPGGAR